jgi:hypothetical protein
MFTRKTLFKKSLTCLALILLVSTFVYPQNFPNKIRGYKVYQTKISVKTEREKSLKKTDAEAFIKIGEPELTDISVTGITLEITAEIEGANQNGKVDFLSFEDFKVNGLDVEVEEYIEPFELKKDKTIILPKPVKIFISAGQTLRGAYKELKDSKTEWTVSGRVFVFGKFKKFGFNFKRVVPIEINLKIENPVKKRLAQNDDSK